jgi:hypothetical protein
MLFTVALILIWTSCSTNTEMSTPGSSSSLTAVAQTSGQLASGTSFSISGSTTSSGSASGNNGMMGGPGGGPHGRGEGPGLLEGTNLLASTDELLAIIDAESAGDFRGLRMHAMGGAVVTNYDASGNVITMPAPPQNAGGPEGCSYSGKQFPKFDSLLAKVARTVIDFGSGVSVTHGSSTVTRAGKIIISRSGTADNNTETIVFEGYKVNGAAIQGTKTRSNTLDSSTGVGLSTTSVTNGQITFSDGTVAVWASSKQRKSNITLDANNRPVSGQIVTDGGTSVKASDGTVIYSHTITKSLVEDISCGGRHHAPVSGTIATVYRTDTVSVDFGSGSCDSNTVTVTLNGVVTTKTLGQ